MPLGDEIKRIRKENRLSQEKLAEMLEVSRQAVTKWEANQSQPSTENLFRIAEIFNTSINDLTGYRGEKSIITETIIVRQEAGNPLEAYNSVLIERIKRLKRVDAIIRKILLPSLGVIMAICIVSLLNYDNITNWSDTLLDMTKIITIVATATGLVSGVASLIIRIIINEHSKLSDPPSNSE